MQIKYALLLLVGILPPPGASQAPSVMPLEKEPHHQLLLRNQDVMVFKVKLMPGDTLLLHRHNHDEASMTMSNGTTVAIYPGQPPVQQKDVSGTVRFHYAGVVHQIKNTGDRPYYLHESISLLRPQGKVRNFCSAVAEGQPLNCPDPPAKNSAPFFGEPQYETEQMRATVIRVQPRQAAPIGEPDRDELIVAVEKVVATSGSGRARELSPGDCLWLGHGAKAQEIKNDSADEARFVIFAFKP
jgi:hypothetical protein